MKTDTQTQLVVRSVSDLELFDTLQQLERHAGNLTRVLSSITDWQARHHLSWKENLMYFRKRVRKLFARAISREVYHVGVTDRLDFVHIETVQDAVEEG